MAFFLLLTAFFISCSNDDDLGGGVTSKISGLVTDSGELKSAGLSTGVQGATVIIVEVQANGSLNTVSTQSVQTDVNGKFVVETKLSGAKNLVVVATKSTSEWKAVVSSEAKSGTTVYAPPLNKETTAEAEVYTRLKATGKTNVVSQADVQLYVNADVAAQIKGNTSAQDQFIRSLEVEAQAKTIASGNPYFGISSSQLQTIATARAQAQASFEAALYDAGASESAAEVAFNNYQRAIIAAYTSNGVSAEAYAKLLMICAKASVNASASTPVHLAASKSFYARLASVLNNSVEAKCREAGAPTSAQITAVVTAGVSLSNSIKTAASIDLIVTAFAQYRSSAGAELSTSMGLSSTTFTTINTNIGVVKTTLNAAIPTTAPAGTIVDAHVSFYRYFNTTSFKDFIQTNMFGYTVAKVNGATEVLTLVNMN